VATLQVSVFEASGTSEFRKLQNGIWLVRVTAEDWCLIGKYVRKFEDLHQAQELVLQGQPAIPTEACSCAHLFQIAYIVKLYVPSTLPACTAHLAGICT
jgi:hypothetical protein